MGHIFISYSRTDTEYAHRLADVLQSRGLNVWIDARLDYGTQWPHELQKQLDSCDAFIVIMTPRSFASEWVQSELQRARRKLKPIFPLLLEGEEPWLSVESTQFYDVRGGKMPDARFFSALQRVAASGTSASTMQSRRESSRVTTVSNFASPKSRTGAWVAVIAVAVLAFVAFAVFAAGPLLARVLNSSPPATVDPSAQDPGIRPTDALELPLTGSTSEALATLTLEPIVVANNYDISRCCGDPGTQRSEILDFTIPIETDGVLRIAYSAATDVLACSDIVLHILWDGVEIYSTERVGPGTGRYTTGSLDLSPLISRGTHTLTLSPEGVVGGCNSGTLGGWAGKLIVHTSLAP